MDFDIGDIAEDFFDHAEAMIEAGADPDDVRAAIIAVAVKLGQLSAQADEEVRNLLLRTMH